LEGGELSGERLTGLVDRGLERSKGGPDGLIAQREEAYVLACV
jgi:hypothetical protein